LDDVPASDNGPARSSRQRESISSAAPVQPLDGSGNELAPPDGMDERTFLRGVTERLRCDEARAEGLVFVVFQELRDRLTATEAHDVAAQLSVGLKRLWEEGERPGRRVTRSHREDFVGEVRFWADLPDAAEAERAVKAVFAVLQLALGSPTGREGEAWDIFSQLPKDLKELWLESAERR
jgi:uncharacterized protein (DUF2267 family)